MVTLTDQDRDICLEFLKRTTLQGKEVNAFLQVVRALEGKNIPMPAKPAEIEKAKEKIEGKKKKPEEKKETLAK